MWSTYVQPVVWSSFVPCNTYYSTSEIINSLSTLFETVPVTSYTWSTLTSLTTISKTVFETSVTTRITDNTSWTTATDLTTTTALTTEPVVITDHYSTTHTLFTTQPVSETYYFESTDTVLTTTPVLTYETLLTTIIGHETLLTTLTGHEMETDLQTLYTTESLTQIYLTSRTALTTLTSRTTYEATETVTNSLSSSISVGQPVQSVATSSLPGPPPPSVTPSSPSATSTAPPESPPPPPAIITAPPSPPPPGPCDLPSTDDFFQVSWFAWRPVPGAEPLATIQPFVDPVSNLTSLSTYCNTLAFEKYYRTNAFDCARGCGPFQTLNSDCDIVVGPVFTGTVCGGAGTTVTQRGSSGNIIDLGTSIVGHGLRVDGTRIPITSTTLQAPLSYTGDVERVDSPTAVLFRRQGGSDDQIVLGSHIAPPPFKSADFTHASYPDGGQPSTWPGANVLFNTPITTALPGSPSGKPTAESAVVSTSAPQTTETTSQQGTSPNTQTLQPSSGDGTPTASPPIRPTSETTPGEQQGSMSMSAPGEASLSSLTCVPLSMVLLSSSLATETPSQTSTATASISVPAQTGNSAGEPVKATPFGWCVGILGVMMM